MQNNLKALQKNSWLHFYQMSNMDDRGEFISPIIAKGQGIYIYDPDNRQYIDAVSGAYCVNVGYGRESILQAAFNAAKKIHFVSPFSASNLPAIQLAEKLTELAKPIMGNNCRVFFVNSGSEAVETAVKIARVYARRTSKPEAHKIICRKNAYHGTTFGAMSFCGFEDLKEGFGPLLPGIYHAQNTLCVRCPLGLSKTTCKAACAMDISNIIEREKSETIAAILIETLETSGGIVPPPPGYLEKIGEIKKQSNTLLIIDEVITGFGRLSHWFSAERYGVQPDMVVCAKGLTSGYDSLGAVIVREEIGNVFLGNDDSSMFKHGSTFGGRPAAAAAALETIKIMEEENLLKKAEKTSLYLKKLLKENIQCLPNVGEIRHEGLITGIDLVNKKGELLQEKNLICQIRQGLVNKGLITSLFYTRNEPIIELAPPLIISEQECETIISILHDVLEAHS